MAGAMVGDFDARSLRVAGGYRVGSEGASNRVPGASTMPASDGLPTLAGLRTNGEVAPIAALS